MAVYKKKPPYSSKILYFWIFSSVVTLTLYIINPANTFVMLLLTISAVSLIYTSVVRIYR